MKQVKALFFDVGGTIFDWKNTARSSIERLSVAHNQTVDGEAFANEWRAEMFKVHLQVIQGNLPWMNADEMHLRALEALSPKYPLLNKVDDKMVLVRDTWHNLQAFTGAAEAINRLRTKYTVVVLTILSWESIVSSSKLAGVQWDGILSCEFLGYYKPSYQSYLKGVSLLGLHPDEAMMVAAHEGDLAAARIAGLHTAYVNVPEDDVLDEAFGEEKKNSFDVEAGDFEALCQALGV
ncbi:MAG: HAD-IA family hydrolase [Chloroflexota bacterium]